MRAINVLPNQIIRENKTKPNYKTYLLYIQTMVIWVCGIVYIYNNFNKLSFFEMGHNYITSSMTVVYMSRIWLPLSKRYGDLITDFITKIHLFHYKHRSGFAMETHVTVHKISYCFTVYMIITMMLGMTFFNAISIYNNYSSGLFSKDRPQNSTIKYEQALSYSLPVDTDKTLRGYILFNIYYWYLSYLVTTSFCLMDLLVFLIIFHLWGHFKILIHDMETFPRPRQLLPRMINRPGYSRQGLNCNSDYSSEELPLVHEKLKECINYHIMLKSFIENMSIVFGPMFLVYNLFHSVVGCLLLLEVSQLDPEALTRYGLLTWIIFQQLIQMSCIVELLVTSSEKLIGAVYNLPWEYMDKSNRMTVMIFLMNVQEPQRVKALGMVNIGVTNMATILKTSFSYFAFLRTVAE